MRTLVDDYFKRDLSEIEELRLEKALLADSSLADSLAQKARERYLAYGQPDPALQKSPIAWGKRLGWGLALAAGLLIGLIVPRPRPVTLPPPAGAKVSWTATRLVGRQGSLGFAGPAVKRDVPVRLTLARRELVVVMVTTLDGRLLKVLQAGILPPGSSTLHWDRADQDGQLITDDQWRVVVEEGAIAGP